MPAIETEGPNADPATVNQVFRAVHSIKGAAGFLGFATLGRLAHELENVLNLLRSHQLVLQGEITDVLLCSTDTLRSMVEDIDHSNDRDITEHLAALELGTFDFIRKPGGGNALTNRQQLQSDLSTKIAAFRRSWEVSNGDNWSGGVPTNLGDSATFGGTLILGGGMAMGTAASAEPVPEPGTLALLVIAALAGVMVWRKKRD